MTIFGKQILRAQPRRRGGSQRAQPSAEDRILLLAGRNHPNDELFIQSRQLPVEFVVGSRPQSEPPKRNGRRELVPIRQALKTRSPDRRSIDTGSRRRDTPAAAVLVEQPVRHYQCWPRSSRRSL